MREFEVKENARKKNPQEYGVKWEIIQSRNYEDVIRNYFHDKKDSEAILTRIKWILNNRDGSNTEDLYAIRLGAKLETEISRITNQKFPFGVVRTDSFSRALASADAAGEEILFIHNHPSRSPPSLQDINLLLENKNAAGLIAGHDGSLYYYTRPNVKISDAKYTVEIAKHTKYSKNTAEEKALEVLSDVYKFNVIKLH